MCHRGERSRTGFPNVFLTGCVFLQSFAWVDVDVAENIFQ